MCLQSLKRSRSALQPPAPSSPSPSVPAKIDRLVRALQSYVLAYLDQTGFAAMTQCSRAWQALTALPTSVPAALRFRRALPWDDRRPPLASRLPTTFCRLLRQAAAAPATGGGGLRLLAMAKLGALSDGDVTTLAGAIRSLPRLARLELDESVSHDRLVRAITYAPLDAPSERTVLPNVRVLALGSHQWTAPLVDVARVFPSLTRLTISPGYLSRRMPALPSTPPSPSDSFAAAGDRLQWQNWRALSLFAHLERLTLACDNIAWRIDVDVAEWQCAAKANDRDGSAEREIVAAAVARDEELMFGADPAATAASLRDRSGDRRPRRAPAFSGVAELETVDWSYDSARPILDLVQHLPRLARLVLRQCNVGSPTPSPLASSDFIANLAALRIERTRDCDIASGVDFALWHTRVASVQVYGLLRPGRTACNFETEPPYATVCTEPTDRHLHNDPHDPEAVAAGAILVAASRRALTVDYHYDPDACVCEFAAPPNVAFVRHPTNRIA